jgi:hypothetical protein
MKQVILCEGCKTIIRKAGSFTAELTRPVNINGINIPGQTEKVVVSLCRECAGRAGYKVK